MTSWGTLKSRRRSCNLSRRIGSDLTKKRQWSIRVCGAGDKAAFSSVYRRTEARARGCARQHVGRAPRHGGRFGGLRKPGESWSASTWPRGRVRDKKGELRFRAGSTASLDVVRRSARHRFFPRRRVASEAGLDGTAADRIPEKGVPGTANERCSGRGGLEDRPGVLLRISPPTGATRGMCGARRWSPTRPSATVLTHAWRRTCSRYLAAYAAL